MQVPLVAPAPIVEQHAQAFRDLFENRCQFDHFQNYVTGLMVLENKSLANISRCVVESADKTNLSRFFSQAPWEAKEINNRRVEYMVEQTQGKRREVKESCLAIDDTLCEHVGSLFEYVARLCEIVRAPVPTSIRVNTQVNASASFRLGMISLLRNDLTLTIGLPIVAGMSLRGTERPTSRCCCASFNGVLRSSRSSRWRPATSAA